MQINQVIITSKPYINKLKQDAKLLAKQPLEINLFSQKKKTLVKKPKSRNKIQKQQKLPRLPTELIIAVIEDIEEEVKKEQEIAISITKLNSKIYKPILYNKAINDLIYGP